MSMDQRSFAYAVEPVEMSLDNLLRRVRGEYNEMPGLSLTMPQAQRLWALDQRTCALVLTTLVERRFLRMTARGRYVRTDRAVV
jgi:hypothetical protein